MRHAGTFQIPTYAIPMLEYGDTTGLTDLDIELVNGFIEANFPHGYVVDWTKIYPILVTYQQEMDCAPYETQFAAMIREVQKTYGYSAEDAMLALKDIFAKTYFKEFQP